MGPTSSTLDTGVLIACMLCFACTSITYRIVTRNVLRNKLANEPSPSPDDYLIRSVRHCTLSLSYTEENSSQWIVLGCGLRGMARAQSNTVMPFGGYVKLHFGPEAAFFEIFQEQRGHIVTHHMSWIASLFDAQRQP